MLSKKPKGRALASHSRRHTIVVSCILEVSSASISAHCAVCSIIALVIRLTQLADDTAVDENVAVASGDHVWQDTLGQRHWPDHVHVD